MRKLISLLAGLILFLSTQAQTNPIEHMDVFLAPIQSDTVSFHSPQMLVNLNDTINVVTIEVTLGTSEGGTDIIGKTFTFTDEGDFLDGTSYRRDRNLLYFNLGTYPSIANCYAAIRLFMTNGASTSAYLFNIEF